MEIEVLEHRAGGIVTKGDVAEGDFARHIGEVHGIVRVLVFFLKVEDLEDAVARSDRSLQARVERGQHAHRPANDGHGDEEADEGFERQISRKHSASTEPDHGDDEQQEPDHGDRAHRGLEGRAPVR